MTIRSITKAKIISIRLSQSESESLTRVRALQELRTNKRVAIKNLIHYLIHWADKDHKLGNLKLPISREVPELGISSEGAYERIAYITSLEDRLALERLFLNGKRQELQYGEADIIREIIKVAESRLFKDKI